MAGVLVILPLGTDHVENISNRSSIVVRELFVVGTCLFRDRYLVTGLHATI
jgi:hypothetical protein